mmetsp:Transcript_6671/g.14454  ORF Transcript_6671/g.14454 Transcript_6671/m.14454 type:complete len:189 (+) Transcript_6671:142-708(+)
MMKLFYLPVRARGEPIRMLLAYGKIQYEDVVIGWEQWPEQKTDAYLFPFGQTPSMEIAPNTVVAQSGAIIRYAAKLANACPSDPALAAKNDMVMEMAMEMMPINPLLNVFQADSENYAAKHAEYFAALPGRLAIAQKALGDAKFFGGATPSYAGVYDICIYILTPPFYGVFKPPRMVCIKPPSMVCVL